MDFTSAQQRHVALVERGLDLHLPPASTQPTRLHTAMRYSLQAGGKRLRPVLVLAAAELMGAESASALPAAVAVECVHTYSLIHDDLPCMDDDDLRRGRPTVHKAFDEATAVLAGDALLTHAFGLLATSYAEQPALAAALTRELADAAGSLHLVGGQMEDLLAEGKSGVTAVELEFIHLNKTAAMIEASFVMGGMIGRAPGAQIATLRQIGRHLGVAFQIIDDILDVTADRAALGKTPGKDAKSGKTTYVTLHGLDAARRLARERTDAALASLRALSGKTDFLQGLIETMAARSG